MLRKASFRILLTFMFFLVSAMAVGLDVAIYNDPVGWNNAGVQLNALADKLDGKVDNVVLFTAADEKAVGEWNDFREHVDGTFDYHEERIEEIEKKLGIYRDNDNTRRKPRSSNDNSATTPRS